MVAIKNIRGSHVKSHSRVTRLYPSLVASAFCLLLATFCGACACRADVELSAFMQIGGRPQFVLTDLDDHTSSAWLGIGDSFRGYRIERYDPQHEALSVRKGRQELALFLKASHVTTAVIPFDSDLHLRGITPADLVVRDSGPVLISLAVGIAHQPVERRFIDVKFHHAPDRCSVQFSTEGPQSISRAIVPEAVRDVVSNEDIAAINAHLAIVREKWLP